MPGIVVSTKFSVNELPQASVAVAVANAGTAGQLIVLGAGRVAMTGGMLSSTVIICIAVDELPQPSTAVHFLLITYDPAQAPGVVISMNVRVTPLPQLSVAVATANTGAAGQKIVLGAGKPAITGEEKSCTLIVCDAVAELPHPSVAVHVRFSEYAPAQLPGVITSADVSVNALPHASTTVGVVNTGGLGQLMVVVPGRPVIDGAVMSCTLMV